VRRCLCLTQAPLRAPGRVGAAEPLGDDALETMLPGRGQHPLRPADEVPRRPPAEVVVVVEEKLASALVGKLARRAAIEMDQIER